MISPSMISPSIFFVFFQQLFGTFYALFNGSAQIFNNNQSSVSQHQILHLETAVKTFVTTSFHMAIAL